MIQQETWGLPEVSELSIVENTPSRGLVTILYCRAGAFEAKEIVLPMKQFLHACGDLSERLAKSD